MDWAKDLENLLADAGRNLYHSENTPFNELAEGNWGGAATAPVSAAFNFLDLPLSATKSLVGTGMGLNAMAMNALGRGDAGTLKDAASLAETGIGRENWESWINEQEMPVKLALEVGLDPTTYLGFGLGTRAAQALKAGAGIAKTERGATGLRSAAGVLEVADFAWNRGPDAVVRAGLNTPPIQAARRGVVAGAKAAAPNLFDYTKQSKARMEGNDVRRAFDEFLATKGITSKTLAPIPQVPGGTKSLALIDAYNVPPFFDSKFEVGVSAGVKQRAFNAYLRMASRRQSQPGLPGINGPGMSLAPAGGPAIPGRTGNRGGPPQPAGQKTFPQLPGVNTPGVTEGTTNTNPVARALGAVRNTIGDSRLGFIPPPPGGYATPFEAASNIDEDNLRDMAEIGAAAMLDYDNDISNHLFGGMMRASEGMKRVRGAIGEKYGPGMDPLIPASWDEMRAIVLEKSGRNLLPHERFAGSFGWPEGEVPTKRIEALQEQIDLGRITEEEALQKAVVDFRKASPEAFETAAGFGAAPMASYAGQLEGPEARQLFDAYEGEMRPTEIDPVTKRATVPDEFGNWVEETTDMTDTKLMGQFDSNRAAYNHYMTSLFGEMDDRVLETLRKMSIEVYYDEIINAASKNSGGNQGATRFLTHDMRGDVSGDHYNKVGIFGERESDIGNRYQDLPEGVRTDYTGRYVQSHANTLEINEHLGHEITPEDYNRITGSKIKNFDLVKIPAKDTDGNPILTKSGRQKYINNPEGIRRISAAQVRKASEALGLKGYTDNPVGGALANVYRIVDMYMAGKDIPVGQSKAQDWYTDAAKEVVNIVGVGNYEDAMMLMDLIAVTSSGTAVEENAQNALRAFAEWKMGSDDFIRNRLGITEEQANSLLYNNEGRWSDPNGLFRSAFHDSQASTTGKVFEEYVRRRMEDDMLYSPVQGGPKTNNFAGSFVYKLWVDSVEEGMPDGPLKERVLAALDKASTIWTEDRHQSRISNLGTAVTKMGAIVNRERGIIASQHVPVRGEDMQAAIWYYSKDRQGFRRVGRNDDMAVALRNAWNARKSPALDAKVREEARATIGPDATEAEIEEFAEDLMGQEIQLAIIQEALSSNKAAVTKALGPGNPLERFWDMSQDSLGIVARSGNGIRSRRGSVSPHSMRQLQEMSSEELARIKTGESYGATYKYDGRNWVPDDATSGFAVALTSAGRALDTAKEKTSAKSIRDFLETFGTVIDDPETSEYIRFGLFPMDDTSSASFDLSVIVPDEATAVRLAQQANQKAIWDIGGGRAIDTGGDGTPTITTPKEVREILMQTFGPSQNASIEKGANVTQMIREMNITSPDSIAFRKIIKPVMEQVQDVSLRLAKAQAGNEAALNASTQTPGGGVLVPGGFKDDDLVDFEAMGQFAGVSTQGNQILNRRLGDGRRYVDVLRTYYDEADADIKLLDAAGAKWGPNADLDDRLEAVGDREDLKDIIKKYAKEGIDIRYADPRELAGLRMDRELDTLHGVEHKRDTFWQLFRSAFGEQALFSPKYHLGNVQGAWIQNAMSGFFGSPGPRQFSAAWKLSRGGLEQVDKEEALRSLKSYQIANKWGFENLPNYITRGGVRAMTSSSRMSGSATGELVGRVTGSERIGKAVGKPFEANADMSQALETVMRGDLWADVLNREMTTRMSVVEDSINSMAVKQGLDDFEFSVLQGINLPQMGEAYVLTPGVLKDHLIANGFTEGYAERAMRNYAEAKNASESLAHKQLDKVQFSYNRRNIDEAAGMFAPFLYWFSRAIPFYGESVLRHPFILTNYMRQLDGIEDAQDDPGLDARQKGFLRLVGTPMGFSLLMNPEALFGVAKAFGFDSDYTPEGQTTIGGAIQWMKARGLGMYPWIDGTMNLLGAYGDTFEPDLLGIRHKALIGAAVNFMRAEAGIGPADAPYQSAMGDLRYRMSSWVSQFTPDWLFQPVPPKQAGNTTEATQDTVIESRVIANNPGLSNQQLLEIMTDDTHPEYQRAFQQTAEAGILQQLINFTLPQTYRLREDTRDVRNAQISTIYEAADKQGVSPYEFKPSAGDAAFGAEYQRLTGQQWKPSAYNNAKVKADLIRASTPEAKQMILWDAEYRALGGEKNAKIVSDYNAILQGTAPGTADVDENSRRVVADRWATKMGYTDNIRYVYQLRDAFERNNAEYGQFKGWQDSMYQLKNQLGGSLDEYRRQSIRANPNAADYFEKTLAYIRETYPQEEWPERLEQYTVSGDAYAAIHGLSTMRNDPVPAFSGVDQTLPAMGLTTPQPAYDPRMATAQMLAGNQGYGLDSYGTWWN